MAELELRSPDGAHQARWRWGGEMWMSGPEWGFLAIDDQPEIRGAAREAIWSDDSQFLAFVALLVQNVPNRKGAEGMTFRVGVVRLTDGKVRYCANNLLLSQIVFRDFRNSVLSMDVNGAAKEFAVTSIEWGST